MPDTPITVRLISDETVAQQLQLLFQIDPSLYRIFLVTGTFPPRIGDPGFAGLARIVCGQKISMASALATWGRLEALPGATTPHGFLALDEMTLQGVGLTRNKCNTLARLAEAVMRGDLDFNALETMESTLAIAELTKYKGIGPWTAELYLMFCTGHPDIFPVGDLALRQAVGDALNIKPTPDERAVEKIATRWAPYRSTAALLLWRFYLLSRNRDEPLPKNPVTARLKVDEPVS
ncbi:MAG: DNA-3-methyladenine glycosylase [Pseudomonadota bacterium]